MKTPRNPDTIHAPVGRYVHQIEVSGESRLLFLSGQLGTALDGSIPDDPTSAPIQVAVDWPGLRLMAGVAPYGRGCSCWPFIG